MKGVDGLYSEQHFTPVCRILLILLVMSMFGMLNSQGVFAKTLKCAVNLIEPYGFLAADGQITGVHFDTMKRVVEEAGFTFEAEIAPFARVIRQLENGDADLAMLYRNEAIEAAAVTVGPCVRENRTVIFGQAGVNYRSLEELRGKEVAHLQGAHYDTALEADGYIKKYYVNSYQQGIEMFHKKRVDAIVGPDLGIMFATKKSGLPLDMFGEPLVLNLISNYLFYSKKTMEEKTLNVLRKTLDRLREEGVIDELRNKYIRSLSSE